MIYKDLFKIKIDGEYYEETEGRTLPKNMFTLQEMKNIYLDWLGHKFEIEYDPIMTEDVLYDEIYEDYERESEEEDYED